MRRVITFILAALFITTSSAAARDLLVPNEYNTIQAAIDAAADEDTVIVADNTYTGPGNRDIDFKGKAITVKSKNGPENCIIDCQGSETQKHRGFYLHSGQGQGAVIEGFTITNAYGDQYGGAFFLEDCSATINSCKILNNVAPNGAAVACYRASPTIADCIIVGNFATFYGGGIYCTKGSSPTITGCTIIGNSAQADGGAIDCFDTSLAITNCYIAGNAANRGGAVRTSDCPSLQIENSTFIGNSATKGGALFAVNCPSGMITNCIIAANSARDGAGIVSWMSEFAITTCKITGNSADYGGGLTCLHSSLTIMSSTISGNLAKQAGGAMYCSSSSPIISNCVISGNSADSCSGIESTQNSSPIIINCIIGHNSSGHDAALCCTQSSLAIIANSILWANEPAQIYLDPNGINFAVVTSTDIQGGWQGLGNINADPLFVMDGPDAVTGTWTQQPIYDPDTNCTILTDAAKAFVGDELAGRLIQISSTHPKQALIASNTAKTIEVFGDLRTIVTEGDNYRLVDYNLRPGSPCIDAGIIEGTPGH